MAKLSPSQWVDLLWRHFQPQIATGAPVYLAVDSALLLELVGVEAFGPDPGTVADQFHLACRELFEIGSARASIKDLAFKRLPGRAYSLVLLLAVQQVLVVESMLNDEDSEISEFAYFPRYRECLGLESVELKWNPLIGSQFRTIWDELEREMLAVPGATPGTITFFVGSGPDLNRRLPFSQALLTTHELTVLKLKAPSLGETSDVVEVLHQLYRLKGKLSRRSRLLITSSDMRVRERVCKQVLSFVAYFDQLSELRTRSSERGVELGRVVAYLDREELFDDVYSIYLQSDQGQRPVKECLEEFGSRFGSEPAILLVSIGDRYIECSKDTRPVAGSGLMLLVRSDRQSALKPWLETRGLGGPETCIFSAKACSLSGHLVSVCESLSENGAEKLSTALGIKNEPARMKLVGGLMADERSRIFLAEYPPHGIECEGGLLNHSDVIFSSGVAVTVREALEQVAKARDFTSFRFSYRGQEIEFAVSSGREVKGQVFGYPLLEATLAPIAMALEVGQPSLRGVRFQGRVSQISSLAANEIMHGVVFPFLRGEHRSVRLKPDQTEKLAEALRGADLPDEVRSKVLELISLGYLPASPLLERVLAAVS